MKQGISGLEEMVDLLEADFNIIDKKNEDSKQRIKDRALLFVPVIHLVKDGQSDSNSLQRLDHLLVRVANIVSQL